MTAMPKPKHHSIEVEAIIFDGTDISALGIIVWAAGHHQKASWDNGELWLTDDRDTESHVEPGWAVINCGNGLTWLESIPSSAFTLTSGVAR